MKSMMKRTTLREIKQSFGRYFAILAIVALGVGFFSGLKVTRNVMVASADHYLKKEQLYDFRLLSTLGFEEVDVEVLAGKEDVRAVSGAYSADILYRDSSDNERVIKVHSLTEGVNGVVLTAGRMPAQADECVVDSNLFSEDMIGQKVVLSENNEEDDLSSFAFREYTITGIAQSSLYVQFERGNSSLGSGRVSGFMYLLPEGFQMDVYTEIYVKFDEDAEIYSEAYKSYIEEKTPLWEVYCGQQAERRYDSIMAEAQEKLDDAQKTLDDKKAEAEKELTDAKDTLTEAQEEIDRALLRAGITDPPEIRLRLGESHLPDEVDVLLDMEQESLADLNALAQVADTLSTDDLKKLGAVVAMAKPETAAQIKRLAENLELFDFAPDAHTPEEYGKYMIQQSGYFDYDENLDGFYDYEGYAQQRMSEEDGMFTDRGYIAYKGYYSMEEVMNGSQSGCMEMGGMT